jgi:hypothetical protein
MSFEDFKEDVLEGIKKYPRNWRKGQSVFNYIDERYGVARFVQFKDNVDCFYNDDNIENFMQKSFEALMDRNTV